MHRFMAFINTGFTGAFGPLWAALQMQQTVPAMLSALKA
jgi:glutathione S-transferase